MHPATPQFDEEQHVQPLQPDRLHGEEVHGEQIVTVDAHEFSPGHAPSTAHGAQARLAKPVAHRRCGDDDAKAFQFADDALIAPARVLTRQTEREQPDVAPNRTAAAPTCVRPALRDQPAMPSKQRRRRDEEGVPKVAREQSAGRAQEEPVDGPDDGPRRSAPQDRELVPQHQDLELLEVM